MDLPNSCQLGKRQTSKKGIEILNRLLLLSIESGRDAAWIKGVNLNTLCHFEGIQCPMAKMRLHLLLQGRKGLDEPAEDEGPNPHSLFRKAASNLPSLSLQQTEWQVGRIRLIKAIWIIALMGWLYHFLTQPTLW